MPDSRSSHTPSERAVPSVEDYPRMAPSATRNLPDFVDSTDLDEPADYDAFEEPYERPHTERLAYDEVAAMPVHRRYYVNDVPSPYLSKRQAKENIEATRRRHTIISTVLVLILITAMLGAMGWFVWDTLKPEERPDVPTYNTATIERMEFVDSIDTTTIVLPIDERSVISEVSGTVTQILAAEGALVNEGDVLYTLDNPTVTETFYKAQEALDTAQASVDAKEQALLEAQADLAQAQGRSSSSSSSNSSSSSSGSSSSSSSSNTYDDSGSDSSLTTDTSNSTTNIARMATSPTFHLAAEYDYGDSSSYTDDTTSSGRTGSNSSSSSSSSSSSRPKTTAETKAEAAVKKAQKELNQAKEDLEPIQAMYDRAQVQYDHLTVRSPINGTVSDLNSSIKTDSGIIGSERLCTVSDLSAYLVLQELPEQRVGQVHEGQEARLSFPSIGDLFVTSFVTDVYDNEEGTARIASVVIENPDERITKNMACNVSIIIQSIPNVLVVPIEALNTNAEGGTELNMLLDPSRGINTYVHVNVLGTNATQAAVEADNIQAGTSVILPNPAEEVAPPEPAGEGAPEPAPEGEPEPAEEPAPVEEPEPAEEPAPQEDAPEGEQPAEEEPTEEAI